MRSVKSKLNELKSIRQSVVNLKYAVINRPEIPVVVTIGKIKRMIENDYEITGGQKFMKLSATCPLTTTRLFQPAKYSTCTHPHCFELEAFLQMIGTSNKFSVDKCPICFTNVQFQNLLIDGFFNKFLHSPDKNNTKDPTAKFVRVYENGEWEWESEEVKTGRKKVIEVELISENNSSNEDNPDKINSTTNGSGPIVITIDDDEDVLTNSSTVPPSGSKLPKESISQSILTAHSHNTKLHRRGLDYVSKKVASASCFRDNSANPIKNKKIKNQRDYTSIPFTSVTKKSCGKRSTVIKSNGEITQNQDTAFESYSATNYNLRSCSNKPGPSNCNGQSTSSSGTGDRIAAYISNLQDSNTQQLQASNHNAQQKKTQYNYPLVENVVMQVNLNNHSQRPPNENGQVRVAMNQTQHMNNHYGSNPEGNFTNMYSNPPQYQINSRYNSNNNSWNQEPQMWANQNYNTPAYAQSSSTSSNNALFNLPEPLSELDLLPPSLDFQDFSNEDWFFDLIY